MASLWAEWKREHEHETDQRKKNRMAIARKMNVGHLLSPLASFFIWQWLVRPPHSRRPADRHVIQTFRSSFISGFFFLLILLRSCLFYFEMRDVSPVVLCIEHYFPLLPPHSNGYGPKLFDNILFTLRKHLSTLQKTNEFVLSSKHRPFCTMHIQLLLHTHTTNTQRTMSHRHHCQRMTITRSSQAMGERKRHSGRRRRVKGWRMRSDGAAVGVGMGPKWTSDAFGCTFVLWQRDYIVVFCQSLSILFFISQERSFIEL